MHKIIIFLFFLMGIVHPLVAQDSKELKELAITYLTQGDETEFSKSLADLYMQYLKENLDDYSIAVQMLKTRQFVEVYRYLDQLIEEGYFLEDFLEDPNFKVLHGQPGWKIVEQRIKFRLSQYNNPIRLELKRIQSQDQGVRLLYLYVEKEKAANTKLVAQTKEKMKSIDEESAGAIQKIVDEYGWLGADIVGNQANETLFLGIQHVDDLVVQEKYLPLLQQAVNERKAEPWQLAFLTDRMLMNQGKKQRYGTQLILSNKEYGPYIVPLEDPDQVDELRRKVGLEPLGEYVQEEGIEWDIEAYKKELPMIERLYQARVEKIKNGE